MPSARSRRPKVLRLSRTLRTICNGRPSHAIFSIGKATPLLSRRGVLASSTSTTTRSLPGSVWPPLPLENPGSNAEPVVRLPWHTAHHLFCNTPCRDGNAPQDYRGFSQHSL